MKSAVLVNFDGDDDESLEPPSDFSYFGILLKAAILKEITASIAGRSCLRWNPCCVDKSQFGLSVVELQVVNIVYRDHLGL